MEAPRETQTGAPGSAAFPTLVLAAVAAALVARAPQLFFGLRLFADETRYFRLALERPAVEVLVSPVLGYYSLVPNLGALLGAHVLPLEWAPLANIALGLACLLVPPLLVMLPGSPIRGRGLQLLAVALLVVVPPSQGRVDVVYAQYYLGLAAALILVSHSPGRGTRRLRLALLTVGGLTGGLAAALAPLFAAVAWWERTRERRVQAAVLGACALLQVAAVLAGAGEGSETGSLWARFRSVEVDVGVAAVALNSVAMPLAGREHADRLGHRVEAALVGEHGAPARAAVLATAAALALGVLALMLGPRPRERPQRGEPLPPGWLLAAAYLLLASLSFVVGLTMGGSRILYLTGHHRYFAAPNGMLIVALVLQVARAGRAAQVLRVLLVWMLLVGTFTMFVRPHAPHIRGPSWRVQVARWREDPSRSIRVWPVWWRPVELPADAAPPPGR